MASENCILLSNSTQLGLVIERLGMAYGKEAFVVEGDPAHWRKITLARRKLLTRASVTFAPLEAVQLEEAQKRLLHVYQSIPAEKPALQAKLLAKIATSRMAIDVQAATGLRGLEEAVFVVAEAMDAIIFWEGKKMLDKTGNLILDFEGRSGVADLEVSVDAALLDSLTLATESGKARKARTETILKARKIPFASGLPPIEGDEHARIRPLEDVVARALALMLVAVKGEGLEDPIVHQVMAAYGIAPFLSLEEQAFIADPKPDQQSRINFCWRYEGLWVMLWVMGYVQDLPFPDQICDVTRAVGIIRDSGNYPAFLAGASLRPIAEFLDQCDLAYRLHWAVTDARIRQQPPPANLDAGVVYERHYAFNWLRGYMGQDWDHVETHT